MDCSGDTLFRQSILGNFLFKIIMKIIDPAKKNNRNYCKETRDMLLEELFLIINLIFIKIQESSS